jgi:hypothetical protein
MDPVSVAPVIPELEMDEVLTACEVLSLFLTGSLAGELSIPTTGLSLQLKDALGLALFSRRSGPKAYQFK